MHLRSHSETEMELISELIYKTRRRFFLEIGTFQFELTTYFLSLLKDSTKDEVQVVCVDIKDAYPAKRQLLEMLCPKRFVFIQGDSTDDNTVQRVKSRKPPYFDIVFIDGNHKYEIVKQDTENYAGMVGKKGYIMWHDATSRISQYIKDLQTIGIPLKKLESSRGGIAYIYGEDWLHYQKLLPNLDKLLEQTKEIRRR